MNLKDAIKTLVETRGVDILRNPILLNILSDYNAFFEHHCSKNIFKNIITEGYLDKIALLYENQLPIENTPQTYLSELYNKYGFRKDISEYVLNSIFEALGFTNIFLDTSVTIKENDDLINEYNAPIIAPDSFVPNGESHFEFRGISINGPIESVVNSLKKLGYQETTKTEEGMLLIGTFAGIDDCQILVAVSPYTGQTYRICVFTPKSSNWLIIKSDYTHMKSTLEKKYGTPSSCTEIFSYPYEEGDGYELTALSSDNVFYITTFSALLGKVTIHITSNAQLLIAYEDNYNSEQHNTYKQIAVENDI